MEKKRNATILISSTQTAAEIRYCCGAEPPENALFIQKGKKGILIVSRMEFNRMCRVTRSDICVKTPEQIGADPANSMADWICKLLPIGTLSVPSSFPVRTADALREKGYTLKTNLPAVCRQREVKNEVEIRCIRKAQRAAVDAMKKAIRRISSSQINTNGVLQNDRVPLTSEQVRAEIISRLAETGYRAADTIVACGPASADPHERGCGPLQAGVPIVIDIFPQSEADGYWGDITRTICRGPAPAELRRQYNAVKTAQAAQLRSLRAGVFTDTVHRIGSEWMEKKGFSTFSENGHPQGFIHGTGHGVGLAVHEEPRITRSVHRKLRAGHVVTIEPGLYYRETGGVRIEDTVLITQDGFRMLAPCRKQLEV